MSSLVRPDIEDAFDSTRILLSVAAAARAKAKLKRRWPLKEAYVAVPPGKEGVDKFWETLRLQMNVETLHPAVTATQASGLEQYVELRGLGMPVVPSISPDRGRLGPRVKGMMGALLKVLNDSDPHHIVESLRNGSCTIEVDGTKITLQRDDFTIGYEPADGYQAASRDGYTVFVSTSSDEHTRAVWFLRDVARRLQNLRRERGYNPTDILDTATILGMDDKAQGLVESGRFDLAGLVRVRRVSFTESGDPGESFTEEDIDGQKIRISIR